MAKKKKGSSAKGKANDVRGYATTTSSSNSSITSSMVITSSTPQPGFSTEITESTLISTSAATTKLNQSRVSYSSVSTLYHKMTPVASSSSSQLDRLVVTPELYRTSLELLRALYQFDQWQRNGAPTTIPSVEMDDTNDRPPLLWMEHHRSLTTTTPTTNNHSDGYIDTTKLRRRLGTIYDTLTQYGFRLHQIVDCVHAISSCCSSNTITITFALDWLCYFTPLNELPSLFTEAIIRDECDEEGNKKKTGVSFIFASAKTSTSGDDNTNTIRVANSIPIVAPSIDKTNDSHDLNESDKTDDDEWRKAHNAYLIAQYQYDSDDDGESVDANISIDLKSKELDSDDHPIKQLNIDEQTTRIDENVTSDSAPNAEMEKVESNAEGPTNDDETSDENCFDVTTAPSLPTKPGVILSDDEILLQNMKIELQTIEDDSKNDANNYMRSKQEMKELKTQISKLRKQVSNLEARIIRQRINETKEAGNQIDGDHEDEVDMFSMFDDEATTMNQLPSSNGPINESIGNITFPDDAIPLNWTGTTPKEYLEELCRKEKYPRPSFHKLSRNGCQMSVKHSDGTTISLQEQGPYSNYNFVQNYLATKALYQMKQTLSLHRIFPPFYRDLWLTWQNDVKQRLHYQAMLLEESRQKVIEELLDIVCTNDKAGAPIRSNPVGTSEKDSPQLSNPTRQPRKSDSKLSNPDLGKKLKENFLLRIQSAQYQRFLVQRENLPIFSRRDEILETIQRNPVTILCAETGSGKTTQCCSFILENALREGNGDKTSILCTQPRRVAAISIAERVSEEWGEESVGKLVGYQIRMEAKRNSETRILFCTTGVILRRLIDDKELNGISHVVVDEVHERQWQIDILLVALRALVNGSRPDLKVILMSATLDKKLFGSFFTGAPTVNVPGRTFPVRSFYLEDLLEHTNHVIEEGSRCARCTIATNLSTSIQVKSRRGTETHEYVASDEVSEHFSSYSLETRKSMDRVDETVINYDLIEDVLQEICYKECPLFTPPPLTDSNATTVGSVLIFLPGIGEIRTLKERLEGSKTFGDINRFDIVPLHSSLTASEQKRAFITSSRQRRKVILSTNIAETSVTIPDVVYVIDSGRFREITRDKRYGNRRLVVSWCSRASAKQRAGRAGRVQPGVCLKLYSSRTECQTMKRSIEPELQRIPLEEVCLTILASEFGINCTSFLSQAPQPPSEDAVRSALHTLEAIGAIKTSSSSDQTATFVQTESLTPLGRLLSKLPVDARVGKMLILGSIFHCTDSILTIAAALSASKSPFATSFENRQDFQAVHAEFFEPFSDFLTFVNVWNAYRQAEFVGAARKFCQNKKLNYSTMIEIQESRCHYLDQLTGLGFINVVNGSSSNEDDFMQNKHNRNYECDQLIHAIVFAGMFPNIGFYTKSSSKSNDYALHKSEQLFIQSSVNAKLTVSPPSRWIAFSEKFGTESRVSISKTAFIPPISLILFGSQPQVLHEERKVCIDDWIELSTPASTSVIFREIQTRLCDFLSFLFADCNRTKDTAVLSTNVKNVISCVGKLFPDCHRN